MNWQPETSIIHTFLRTEFIKHSIMGITNMSFQSRGKAEALLCVLGLTSVLQYPKIYIYVWLKWGGFQPFPAPVAGWRLINDVLSNSPLFCRIGGPRKKSSYTGVVLSIWGTSLTKSSSSDLYHRNRSIVGVDITPKISHPVNHRGIQRLKFNKVRTAASPNTFTFQTQYTRPSNGT